MQYSIAYLHRQSCTVGQFSTPDPKLEANALSGMSSTHLWLAWEAAFASAAAAAAVQGVAGEL